MHFVAELGNNPRCFLHTLQCQGTLSILYHQSRSNGPPSLVSREHLRSCITRYLPLSRVYLDKACMPSYVLHVGHTHTVTHMRYCIWITLPTRWIYKDDAFRFGSQAARKRGDVHAWCSSCAVRCTHAARRMLGHRVVSWFDRLGRARRTNEEGNSMSTWCVAVLAMR